MTAANDTSSARAFTLFEAIITLGIFCLLVLLIVPAATQAKRRAQRIMCTGNQGGIVLSLVQWSMDQSNCYPTQVSISNGGTRELVESGILWPHFQIASNELNTPKILVCPADKRRSPARSFATNFSNASISYFLGVDVQPSSTQMFLTGDSNLLLGGTNIPRGLVTIFTNSPVAWNSSRHERQGQIALADGSVSGFTTATLRRFLQSSGPQTNRLILP